jgi:hypothetical protein
MTESLDKAESTPKTVTRPLTNEKGQSGIVTSSRFIQDLKKDDLKLPRRFCTYENMMLDDAVGNSVDTTNIQVVAALNGGQVVAKDSNLSKQMAKFLNYCIRNMGYGTWMEAMNNAATDLTYGFAIENIVLEKAKYGEYKGAYTLKKLAPRDPKSLYGWVWDKHNRDLKGFVQKPNLVQAREKGYSDFSSNIPLTDISGSSYLDNNKYPFISTQQMLHFRHNPTFNNPQGNSPLNMCYDALTEKKLVEHYEVVGVSKDFGGLVVVRVPSELIERANDPTRYPEEAKEYAALQSDASRLQAGKSTHIVLTSDVDEYSKKYLYDLELKGIQGGGTQYRTEDIINQKRKSIYNVFGTGFLLLGQNGHGSNALAGSQMTTHDYFIRRCIDWKVDVINTQLIPRLLAANDIYLPYDQMPVFVPDDPSKPDHDTLSKVLQRGGSVELLTDAAIADLYTSAGWSLDGLEEHLVERKEMNIQSRAGESKGSSGTGDTQSGGAASSTNSENKSMESFEVDYETEDELVVVNTTTGAPMFIKKNL